MGARAILLAIALCAASFAARADAPHGSAWEQDGQERGVRLWRREVPGRDLPAFRGLVVIDATPDAIAAVITDVRHHTEWMHRCLESTELKALSDHEWIIYNRTDAPWPVWDRDVVLDSREERAPDGSSIVLRFQKADDRLRPPPARTVRMPRLAGFYEIKRLENGKSEVTYQVDADPGGRVPRWMAKRIVHDLPSQTLSALRDRVTKKR